MKSWSHLVAEAKQVVPLLSVHDVKKMQESGSPFILMDVREPEEHQKGAIPEAVLVPRGVLEMTVEEKIPDRTARIVLHCAAGGRSAVAAQSLHHMGYENVASMEGGFRGWVQAGYPVKKP